VYLPTDKMTNEPKGFAFVNFDSSEIVETLINEAKITINGKEVINYFVLLCISA